MGQGGTATVYVARDVKHDRLVAIKALRPALAASVGAARFLREIKLAAVLQHPHILPLYDSGDTHGVLYYVTPYVEGQSLRHRLDRERQLPLDDALQIVREVADALSFAHSHGVVHRDVKPENIMLSDGHALVADFGIARAIRVAERDRVTATGIAVGTPLYMSPEQAVADESVDGRSDLYSLSCVLYEMLAGGPPFTGPTAQAIMARHSIEAPPLLRTIRPSVPGAVETAILKALSKAPADRFASVRQFAQALGSPAVGAAPRAKSIAVLPFVNLTGDKQQDYFGDGMAEELINALTKVPGLKVAARTSVFAYRGQALDLPSLGARLHVSYLLTGSVRTAGQRLRVTAQLAAVDDGYQLWSESYERQLEDVFAVQDEISRAIIQALKIELGGTGGAPLVKRYTDDPAVYTVYLKGRFFWNKRPRQLDRAIACFNDALAQDATFAPAYAGLADCYAALGSWESGVVAPSIAFPRALAAAQRALDLDPTLAEPHSTLGYTCTHHRWDWSGAERELRRALELNPAYAPAHHWLSHHYLMLGQVEASLAASMKALELEPLEIIMQSHLAWHYHFARRYEEAVEQSRRVLELDPANFWSPLFAGLALEQQQRFDDAAAQLETAMARSGDSSVPLAALGHTYARAGRGSDARRVLAALEGRAERGYASAYEQAVILLGLGEVDRAFGALDRAVAARDGWLPYLKLDPRLDPLRSDPRFSALCVHVGIP